jgi:hypothetical protein
MLRCLASRVAASVGRAARAARGASAHASSHAIAHASSANANATRGEGKRASATIALFLATDAAMVREQLARRMGLWGQQLTYKLPAQLPALPKIAELRSGDDAEATALRQRLDLGALRRDLDVTAGRQGWATIGSIFGVKIALNLRCHFDL